MGAGEKEQEEEEECPSTWQMTKARTCAFTSVIECKFGFGLAAAEDWFPHWLFGLKGTRGIHPSGSIFTA